MIRRTTLWLLVGMLGIAVTASIAWAASLLASQRIGLSSEPPSVAAALAPPPSAEKQPARARAQTKPHTGKASIGQQAASGSSAPAASGSSAPAANGSSAPTPPAVAPQPPSSLAPPSASSGSATSPAPSSQSASAPAPKLTMKLTASGQRDDASGDGGSGSSGSQSGPDD